MAEHRQVTAEAVIDAAVNIVKASGLDALSLNSIAALLQVKPPSLYNHVKGIEDVRRRLFEVVLQKMAAAVDRVAVGRSKEEALREIAHAYRRFAKEEPELYRVYTHAPKVENGAALVENLAQTLRKVLSAFGLSARAEVNFIRLFHSSLQGFVSLENAGFFNQDADINESFRVLIDSQILILDSFRRTKK
jgi:AcrR family transcriptional regulator